MGKKRRSPEVYRTWRVISHIDKVNMIGRLNGKKIAAYGYTVDGKNFVRTNATDAQMAATGISAFPTS